MIALKFFPFAPLVVLLCSDLVQCYPSSYYNGKRYSRSTPRASSYDDDYYLKAQRYPYSYYPSYAQFYPEEYYYSPDSYPMYYVTPRAPKYDPYKASLPYYYQDPPVSRVQSNKYNYYNYPDASMEEQERLLQEYEIEQREKSQPIGHEIRYEGDYNIDDNDDEGVDETNAAFLNNLMMQQMYHNPKTPAYYDQNPYGDYNVDDVPDAANFPTKWDDVPYDRPVKIDDEDVKELKELPKKQKQRKQRKQRKQKNANIDVNESLLKRSADTVVYTDRKPIVKSFPTSPTPAPTEGPKRDARGQKEEVQMRPATPVRHPFSDSVLNMISQQEQQQRKRTPSVYDTIRHMLEMEEKYEEDQTEPKPEMKSTMKKRIVSSEDSLTRQLSVLKKAQ